MPIEISTAGQYTVEVVAWADQAGDEFPQLEVAVLDATPSGSGAEAIRAKLVELHDKLLGVKVTPYSPDVNAAFELFLHAEELRKNSENNRFLWWQCDSRDIHFFDGILDDIVIETIDDRGNVYYSFDRDRRNSFMQNINFSDIHGTARAWVVVLSYLLMDYRYLYL